MMTHESRSAADATAARSIEERYEKLLKYLDEGFCVVEVIFDDEQRPIDYRFLETNAAFVERTGLEEAVGKRMRELRPAHERHWFEWYGHVALTGETVHFDAEAHALGRSYHVCAFRVDEPSQHHVAILFGDTTAADAIERDREKRLSAERAARVEAEAAMRAKSEFLAVMSHELRTPINAFIGYVQLLEMGVGGPVTEQQRAYLGRMATSAEHLLTLIGDILDLTKIDAGELEIGREVSHTAAAVETALGLTAPQAEARGVKLVDHHAGTQGAPYIGDEQRVRQILTNLLSNAVKFTEAGGRVEVASRLVDEAPPEARVGGGGPWASITVKDTGIGIDAAAQQRVFDEFFQIDTARTRAQGGTGLGLAISRRLARLMGGDLTVESAPGLGSTFTLWLPADGGPDWGVEGAAETSAARSQQAHRAGGDFRVYSYAEIGTHLRAHLEAALERFVGRLRADPVVAPTAHERTRVQLEDHVLSYLADFCQSLVIADSEPEAARALARDGTAIQRAIAELHGRQRERLGWSERQLIREHELLHEEITGIIRESIPEDTGDITSALELITRLLDRAAEISLGAYRRSAVAVAGRGSDKSEPPN